MKKTLETIVFFGSGPVSAKSLSDLSDHFIIEAVITKPKPGHHKESFPVIEVSNKLGLKTYYPKSRHEVTQLFNEVKFSSTIALVIDYGIIIDQPVIDSFKLGIINSHFSLLPKYRGPDPITSAILNGDQYSGVSLMLINSKLDEGDILTQETININDNYTTVTLTQKLIDLSNKMLINTVPDYLNSLVQPKPQSNVNVSYTKKLSKSDGVIDWNKSALDIERQIRAYIDWPGSKANLSNIEITITKAHVFTNNISLLSPGSLYIEDGLLGVFCKESLLIIDSLKPSGKSEMSAKSFLNGYRKYL